MKAAILGATGYTGMILLRILADHPEISEIFAASSSRAGKSIKEIAPGVYKAVEPKMKTSSGCLVSVEEAAAMKPEVVFAALPHLESAKICEPFFDNSVVIDLSADFRIKDPVIFEKSLRPAAREAGSARQGCLRALRAIPRRDKDSQPYFQPGMLSDGKHASVDPGIKRIRL